MKKILSLIFIITLSFSTGFAQDDIFNQPVKQLVVDNANLFSKNEIAALTQKLNQFNSETSTQVLIYTTPDLYGYDVADFAQRLGEGWKVGQQGFDNGIVLVFKPKTSTPGRISISVGYGIEEFIPDVTANQIIENEMIPLFKQGRIFEGIDKGIDVCISLTKEEFTAKQYAENNESLGGALFFILVFIIVFISMFGKSRSNRYYDAGRRSNLPLWTALFLMGSGSHRGSGWSDFSSGSGSFGGGSSFGGFGGGSFGGGGASGSW